MKSILLTKQQDYMKAISRLRIIDDDFMIIVFDDQACLELLLTLIFKEHISVSNYYRQYILKNLHGRDIEIDILVETNQNQYINIEVQRRNVAAHPKRARYHQSLIDADITFPQDKWKDIPEVYVIFITENDVLKGGLPIYHVNHLIEETGEQLDDGTKIIYVNVSFQDNTPLGRLMNDMMCEIFDEIKQKGIVEGKNEEKIEIINQLMNRQELSFEEVMNMLGISIGEQK